MSETNLTIKCETEGFEEAIEKVEVLANAYDGFPAQVVIKNCHNCVINVYPSQMRIDGKEEEG